MASCVSSAPPSLSSPTILSTDGSAAPPAKKPRSEKPALVSPDSKKGRCEKIEEKWGGAEAIKAFRVDYDRHGFLLLRHFYGEEEVELISALVKEIQSTKEEVGGQMMWFEKSSIDGSRILNRVEDFCRRNAGMADLFMHPTTSKLMEFMHRLTGEGQILFKDKINFKQPGGDGFKAHQDQAAGWGNYINLFVSIGIFVDHSTIENGALEVAPGLHKKGLLGKEWEPIEGLDLPYQWVTCEPGDVVIFDSFVPHRSGPNTSQKQRRALFLTYNSEAQGEHLSDYYADKRRDFPPDIERPKGKEYVYRV